MANTTFSGPVRSENGFQDITKDGTTGAVTTNSTYGNNASVGGTLAVTGNSTLSGSALAGTGMLFCQLISWGYSSSLSSQANVSLKTAILRSPTTTSFCSLKGCSQDTKIWARRPD